MKRFLFGLALVLCASLATAQPIGLPQLINVQDSGTACGTAGTCAVFQTTGLPSVALGITITGSPTLTFECSTDGSTWTSLLMSNMATGVQATTATAAGNYSAPNPGCLSIRARGTTVSSATATVTASRGSGMSVRLWPSFGGSLSTGQLLYASATQTIAGLSDVATGSVLVSQGVGVAPAYSASPTLTSLVAVTVNATTAYQLNGTAGVGFAFSTALPADQTGNGTATLKMNGLGAAAAPCTITPTSTGRVVFHVEGDLTNSTILDGIAFKLVYGTGTAPANAAAASGTALTALRGPAVPVAAQKQAFTAEGAATGLALATAVWYDLQVADVTGGTASISNVTCTAHEI